MIVGLTGGIGSGKSAADQIFANHGIQVLDADKMSHSALDINTPGFSKVVNYFGNSILADDGAIDRSRLRAEAFSYPKKKLFLESIIHPFVHSLIFSSIEDTNSPYTIISVPLIFETNSASAYNRILVIDCPVETQIKRATHRDSCSEELIHKIVRTQCTREQRLSIANDVISNDTSLEDLTSKVKQKHNFYLGLVNND